MEMGSRWSIVETVRLTGLVSVLLFGCGDDERGGRLADAAGGDPGADAASPGDASPEADAAPVAEGMVRVPAGAFAMGCDDCGDDISPGTDERPLHQVTLSTFDIDVTEVTQAAYAACVADASACTEPSSNYDPGSNPMHPVRNVSWDQAVSYCGWAGKRLPTEAEWEKAARGTDGRLFPWGDDDEDDCANANTSVCGEQVLAVGQSPEGASPYGALDMAGNVWEWVHDYYDADAYADHEGPDPQGPARGTNRVYRGGSYGNLPTLARATNRADTYNPEVGGAGLGFRCAVSAE
jgi:formylglycine-generating enzyme required for sulfatase activity